MKLLDRLGDLLGFIIFRRGKFTVMVAEVLLVIIAVTSTVWWYVDYGWWGLAEGILLLILAGMIGLWFF